MPVYTHMHIYILIYIHVHMYVYTRIHFNTHELQREPASLTCTYMHTYIHQRTTCGHLTGKSASTGED